MKPLIIVFTCILIFVSCKKTEINETKKLNIPDIPLNYAVDIDNDNRNDFEISYSFIETNDIPRHQSKILLVR